MFNEKIQIKIHLVLLYNLKNTKTITSVCTKLYKHIIFYFKIFTAQVWGKKVYEIFFVEHNKTTL